MEENEKLEKEDFKGIEISTFFGDSYDEFEQKEEEPEFLNSFLEENINKIKTASFYIKTNDKDYVDSGFYSGEYTKPFNEDKKEKMIKSLKDTLRIAKYSYGFEGDIHIYFKSKFKVHEFDYLVVYLKYIKDE